ncbi:hypothetical protein DJ71_13445 [Halorubrum sp. E3]|nr:hypothetical protein DJ71_13445 [Halorubrum sp. E3]
MTFTTSEHLWFANNKGIPTNLIRSVSSYCPHQFNKNYAELGDFDLIVIKDIFVIFLFVELIDDYLRILIVDLTGLIKLLDLCLQLTL